MGAWLWMCQAVRVLIINTGRNERTIRLGGSNCLEARIAMRRISSNSIASVLSRGLFGGVAPSILLNVDALFFSLFCLVRFRDPLAKATRVHTYHFWFALISLIFPRLRKKLVYTELGGEWVEVAESRASKLVRLRYAYLGRWVLSRVRVIAQSESNKRNMVRCGIPSRNIVVVHHGRSDPNLFHPTVPKSSSTFNILYVGRIVPQKGLQILAEASNLLVNQRGLRDIVFTVIGPIGGFGFNATTSYYENVRKYIDRHGILTYYKFMGHIPTNELVDIYSRANVYVLPSIQDALPLSVTEAQMCGTPVIGTYSGGMVEMIEDGVTGFVIPVNNPGALAEKLEHLASHRQECFEMGLRARSRALQFFSNETFPQELLDAVLGETKGV